MSANAVDRVNPVFSLNARISHLTQGLYSKEAASLGIIAESFAGVSPRIFSRSCVWGVTARSILYAIHNGAAGVDPDTLHTRAATARLVTHTTPHTIVSSERWCVLSVTGQTPCCPPASTTMPYLPRATAHRRAPSGAASGRTFSSFPRPMPCIFPTARLLHSSLVTGPLGTLTRRRLRTSRDPRPTFHDAYKPSGVSLIPPIPAFFPLSAP